MTPMRVILLLAVLVIVLFCISLAVGKRNEGNKTSPTNSWASKFNKRFEEKQKLPISDLKPPKDVRINDGKLSIPQTETTFVVLVLTNSDRPVRKTEIMVEGSVSFKVNYDPADPEAIKLNIPDFDSKKPIKLVFQESGGKLTFTRKPPAMVPATVIFK